LRTLSGRILVASLGKDEQSDNSVRWFLAYYVLYMVLVKEITFFRVDPLIAEIGKVLYHSAP
jgi:hypothetical protein